MGDVQHGARKKKPSGPSKTYYYSLTYDEENSGSGDEGTERDELQRRVANILAETEHIQEAPGGAPEVTDGRLDFNDNLFGGNGSLRNSRSLDFDMSDDDEFQSADSKSDNGQQELDTESVGDDFVQITRPIAEPRVRRAGDTVAMDDGSFPSATEQSPKASGSLKRPGNSPLAVVFVKQKPTTELYDGNFIDDDILQPQEERTNADNISQDLLPMPVEEMTLDMDEEDDGIPDTGSGIDADPIIFRKSSERWFARHRKLVIGVAVVASLVAAGGLAAIIYFAVSYAR